MKEMFNSITEVIKNRLTNSLYGTFFISWLIFHWGFIFSMFTLNDTKILEVTGLLKNDYLVYRYFDLYNWHFWFSWISPFILTYIIIWKLPEWLLLKAYEKTEEYEVGKKIISISGQRRIEQEEAKLQEQTAKKVTAVAKQAVEEKKIKDADPTIDWETQYSKFRDIGYNPRYSQFLKDFYSGQRYSYQFIADDVSYFDALGLIKISDNGTLETLTDKGRYFAVKVKEEIPF